MTETGSKTAVLMAGAAVALIVALSALGLIWYGVSAEVHQRSWKIRGLAVRIARRRTRSAPGTVH